MDCRKRLLFPKECKMIFTEKLKRAMQLGSRASQFRTSTTEGRERLYLTACTEEAEQILAKGYEGYKRTVMSLP